MPGTSGRHILVLNAGSSSVKYAVFKVGKSLKRVVQGLAEGIGVPSQSCIMHQDGTGITRTDAELPDHKQALALVLDALDLRRIGAVGHRVVHGGEKFSHATLINDDVVAEIGAASSLAPMHNPWNLLGIKNSQEIIGGPQVAVFDTAFHQTIEPHAYLYALPYNLYEKHGIRKYGFHGTSYLYVLGEVAKELRRPVEDLNVILCHLGSGASMCAVRAGKCIDTTMGLTPLEGLVMGTRSGDLDPAILLHLMELGYSKEQIVGLLNKQSGLLGLCGLSDNRDVEAGYAKHEPRASLAKAIQVYRTRKYLGAYIVALEGHVDALVFTGGIGENSSLHRALVCKGLERLGVNLDEAANEACSAAKSGDRGNVRLDRQIEQDDQTTQIWVIPTDEELSIAQQTAFLTGLAE